MKKNRKAQDAVMGIGGLAGAAITFVVVAIVIVIGLDLTGDLQSENACPDGFSWVDNTSMPGVCCDSDYVTDCNLAHNGTHGMSAFTKTGNATVDGIDALGDLSSRLDLLATAVILGVIIVVLLKVFEAF